MKKLLLSILFVISICFNANAQVLFDFEVDIKTKSSGNTITGDVTISLNSEESPIKYQIMPEGQIEGQAIFESEFITKRKYKFKDVPKGKYLVKITNKQGRMAFNRIEIAND